MDWIGLPANKKSYQEIVPVYHHICAFIVLFYFLKSDGKRLGYIGLFLYRDRRTQYIFCAVIAEGAPGIRFFIHDQGPFIFIHQRIERIASLFYLFFIDLYVL